MHLFFVAYYLLLNTYFSGCLQKLVFIRFFGSSEQNPPNALAGYSKRWSTDAFLCLQFSSSELKDLYSFGDRIKMKEYFLNNAMDGGGRKEAQVFTESYLQERGECY